MNISKTLSLNLPVGGADTVSIGDQPTLRGVKIKAVIARIRAGATDKSSAGVELAENLNNAFLTLSTAKGEAVIDALPLTVLDPAKNNGQIQELQIKEAIDWSKSFVKYPGKVPTDAGKHVPLVIVYE